MQLNPSGEYADAALEAAAKSAFLEALKRFMAGSKEYRDSHLKFIPHLIEGPWVAKKAVGTKPAVIGTKLKLSYHTNPQLNYLEVDIDVCSSKIAANIFSVVKKGSAPTHRTQPLSAKMNRGSPIDTVAHLLLLLRAPSVLCRAVCFHDRSHTSHHSPCSLIP